MSPYRLFCLLISCCVFASANATQCDSSVPCASQGEWTLGVALGVGARSNPLVDGDVLPNILLLDVAWYGQNFYFDNAELGYRLIDSDEMAWESYLTVDREASYFNLWHVSNIAAAAVSPPPGIPTAPPDNQGPENDNISVSVDDVNDRNWAINIGTRIHFYPTNAEITFALETDASGVHQGHKARLTYEHFWSAEGWQLSVRPSITWKSDALIDYYYGISQQDTLEQRAWYQGKGGLQPALSVLFTKKINDKWHWIGNASYQRLHSGMTDSPLVEDHNIINVFFGVGYRF